MKWLKELLSKNEISDEKIDQILSGIEEDHYIPKSRFDQVNDQKKVLQEEIETRDQQLEELKVKAEGNQTLLASIEELKKQNDLTSQEYEEKLKGQAFEFALENKLRDSKVKNTKAVKALLDLETVKLDGDKLLGIDEQIANLEKSEPYLFHVQETQTGTSGNFGRSNGQKDTISKEDFQKMNYKERLELYNSNREVYDSLKD